MDGDRQRRGRLPAATTETGSRVVEDRLARAPAPGAAARRRGQLRRDRRGRADRLRPRDLGGCWQNWLENLPHFGRPPPRAIALDLPGFGDSPMPSWPIDMPAYGRLIHDFCEKLGIERRGDRWSATRWAAWSPAEAVLGDPGRFDRLVLVSAAGFINTWLPRERGRVTSGAWDAFGARSAARGRFTVTARLRRWIDFGFVIRYPNRLRRSCSGSRSSSGVPCPGFGDALPRDGRIRRPRPPRRDRDPDPDRLGHGRLGRSRPPPPTATTAASPTRAWRSSTAPATSPRWSGRSGSTGCWRNSSAGDGAGQSRSKAAAIASLRARS